MIDSDGGGTLDQDELRAAVKDPEVRAATCSSAADDSLTCDADCKANDDGPCRD